MTRRCVSFCFWLVMTGVAVTSLVVIGGNLFTNRVDLEIQSRLVKLIGESFPAFDVRIRATRRIEGKGIEVRGLSLLGKGSRELLYIDELFLDCDVAVTDLLSGVTELKAVTARRMRLSGYRDESGKWNLAEFFPFPKSDGRRKTPPIRVVDGTIVLTDGANRTAKGDEPSWVFRNVQFSMNDQPLDETHDQLSGEMQQPLYLHMKLSNEHFDELVAHGVWDQTRGVWQAKGEVAEVRLTSTLFQHLPAKFTKQFSDTRIQGSAGLKFTAHSPEVPQSNASAATIPFHFEVIGSMTQGRISDRRLPGLATAAQGQFLLNNDLLTAQLNHAVVDGAQITARLRKSNWQRVGSGFIAHVAAKNLTLRPKMADAMPLNSATYWRRVAPVGRTNLDLALVHNGKELRTDATLELLDVAFSLPDFPYRLEHGSGTLRLRGTHLTAENFRAFASGRQVNFRVDLTNPGDQAVGMVQIRVPDPLPMDERLFAAFDPQTRDELRAFSPRGGISFFGAYRRTDPTRPFDEVCDVGMHQISVRHRDFPYRLEKINGTLSFRDGRWSCRDVVCRNRSAQVSVTGTWQANSNARAGKLKFDCRDVPLDEELRESIVAVNAHFGRSWSQLRPRGAIDQMHVDYSWQGGKSKIVVSAHKWSPEKNLDSRTISVHPTWFPYRLEQVTGSIVVQDGKVDLHNVKGSHGKSQVSLTGVCSFSNNQRWNLKLKRLIADKLVIDRSLLRALPASLSKSLESLKISGSLHLVSGLDVWGTAKGPPRITCRGQLALVNNDIHIGAPLKSIFGEIRFAGVSKGDAFTVSGDIDVDSLMYQKVQITKFRGPFRIEPTVAMFGRWAEQVQGTNNPRRMTARVFDGELVGDAKVALSGSMPFSVEAQLRRGKMATFAREVQLRGRKVSGRVAGAIRLKGNLTQGYRALDGRGVLQVQEADLYEVPLVVALLSLLRVTKPDRNAFTDVNVAFNVRGDQLLLNQIRFKGGAVTMKGSGWMDFDRRINLTFFTLVGRDEIRIPILTSLFEEGSRRILEIQVAGTIDQPRIENRAFPELDDTLKRIFPNFKQPKRVRTSNRFRMLDPRQWIKKE